MSTTYIERKRCGTVAYALPLEARVKDRVAIYKMFQNASAAQTKILDLCGAGSKVQFRKLLAKNSASQSVQLFVDYMYDLGIISGKREMFYKISIKGNEALDHEVRAYRDVTNPLILNRNTPFLVAYYATFESKCAPAEIDAAVDVGGFSGPVEEMALAHPQQQQQQRVLRVLCLERAMGKMSLFDAFTKYSIFYSATDFVGHIFQVVWTLRCFQDYKFAHNDLHLGNIFVGRDPEAAEVTTRYFGMRGGHVLGMRSPIFTQIFDYDASIKEPTRFNDCSITHSNFDPTDLTMVAYGRSNTYDAQRDLFAYLTQIYVELYEVRNDYRWAGASLKALQALELLDLKQVEALRPSPIREVVGKSAIIGSNYVWDKNAAGEWTLRRADLDMLTMDEMLERMANYLIEAGVGEHIQYDGSDALCNEDTFYTLPSLMKQYNLTACGVLGQDRRRQAGQKRKREQWKVAARRYKK